MPLRSIFQRQVKFQPKELLPFILSSPKWEGHTALQCKHLSHLSLLPIVQNSLSDITALQGTPVDPLKKKKKEKVSHLCIKPCSNICFFKNKAHCSYGDWDLLSPLGKKPQRGLSHLSMACCLPTEDTGNFKRTGKVIEMTLAYVRIPTVVNRCFFQCWKFMYCPKCLKPAMYYSSSFSTKTATVKYILTKPCIPLALAGADKWWKGRRKSENSILLWQSFVTLY